MSSSLDDLWDEPVVEDIPKRHKTPHTDSEAEDSSRPAKRPRQTLFLPGGSDDEGSDIEVMTRPPPQKDIDIDAIFEGIDDVDDEPAYKPIHVVNADEMERQMEAQFRKKQPTLTPHQLLSSSSPARDTAGEGKLKEKGQPKDGEEKKSRRRPVLLNEGLLLGPTGFPQLIKDVKDFKIKGKGHEASDLNRLLGIYQFWTHGLYPKTQFHDTVTRIEKLCHTKRMQVALSVWKDEAKGTPPQLDDSEDEDMEPKETASRHAPRQCSKAPRSDSGHTSSSPPPSRPPTSASEYDDIFDDDIEAILQEERTSTQPGGISSSTLTTTTPTTLANLTAEDDDFWAELDGIGGGLGSNATSRPPPPPPEDVPMDEDQELWDMMDANHDPIPDELMKSNNSVLQHQPDTVPRPSPPPPPPPQEEYSNPEDWDDMYA